jgi:hypothetical protein
MELVTKFKNVVTNKMAILSYMATFFISIIYNTLVLLQVVDYKYAWGGQLQNTEQMYAFGALSLILQIVFMTIVLIKHKSQSSSIYFKITRVFVLGISAIFLLNTFGNIFAVSLFEKIVFTPMTLVACIASLRIALDS